MSDQLEALLRRSPLTQSQRADVWDAYNGAEDSDALTASLERLSVPKQVKASLWDLKEASAKPPRDPTVEAFPTTGDLMGRMAGSAVSAVPGIVAGTAKGIWDAARLAQGNPSDEMRDETNRHIAAAMAPGASVGTRLSEGVKAIPLVGPMAAGTMDAARTILKPVADATAGVLIPNPDVNVGRITPDQMNAAADTGGAAIANLAAPKIAEGASKISAATVGNMLKFTAKHAAMEGVVPGGTIAGKAISTFVTGPLFRAAGAVIQDGLFEALAQRDLPRAANKILQFMERNPEAAAAYAKDVAKVAGAEPAAASAAPAVAEAPKTFAPTDSSQAAVEARNAAKRARGPLAKRQARAETQSTVVATPVVEQAVSTLEKRAKMPEKGNVKLPTVYTKPAGTEPIKGRPLTPKQREMRLKQLEAARDAGLDIWDVFGTAKED